MTSIRKPAVAGMFYPADAEELRREVLSFLRMQRRRRPGRPRPSSRPMPAISTPGPSPAAPTPGWYHARKISRGSSCSAPLTVSPSRTGLQRRRDLPHAPWPGAGGPSAFEAVQDLPQVRRYEAPFNGEHCLEVQLPFLQMTLKSFRIVPFLVGDARPTRSHGHGAPVGRRETLIVISSDLSHYLDYESARAIDTETSRAIETCVRRPFPTTRPAAATR